MPGQALLSETLSSIGPLDRTSMELARQRQDSLTKPKGSLGRLESLSIHLAGIFGDPIPRIRRKAVVVMAADHGVVRQGVSLYPQEVTAQMVLNFLSGGAAINVLARLAGARIVICDMGVAGDLPAADRLIRRPVARGTNDISTGPAMNREQALAAIEHGIRLIASEAEKGLDAVAVGEMGIGNTTAASAVTAAITRQPAEVCVGRGTGIGDAQLEHKVAVVKKALEVNRPDPADPVDVLAKVGGFEIGGLTGVIVGAAARRIPVVLDGFISTSAALIACGLNGAVRHYLIAGHRSAEFGHGPCLDYLELEPLLDLGMRLGEGTGAALGLLLVEAASRLLAEMATFDEAGVSRASQTAL